MKNHFQIPQENAENYVRPDFGIRYSHILSYIVRALSGTGAVLAK